MATSVSAFVCTIPAGTTTTVPLNVNSADPVVAIHWRVPPGPRGHLAWFLAQSGVQVLPNKFGTAIVADGQSDTWLLNDFPESSAWSLVGTNGGSQNHTVYLEFSHEQTGGGSDGGGGYTDLAFPTTDAALVNMWTGAGAGLILA